MLKTALIIIFSLVGTVHAQTFDFNKAYQDYIYTQSKYQTTHSDYLSARASYLKNPTLSLKEEARKKTLAMLSARDELERVYLTSLRVKIAETGGVSSDKQNDTTKKIDDEVAWYQEHKGKYSESDPLETLFNKSLESKERFDQNTSPIIYNSLFVISLGEVIDFRNDHEAVYGDIRKYIQSQVDAGKVTMDPFNRWFDDIETNTNRLKDAEVKADEKNKKLNDEGSTSPKAFFTNSIQELSESQTYLLQFNDYLKELIATIESVSQTE